MDFEDWELYENYLTQVPVAPATHCPCEHIVREIIDLCYIRFNDKKRMRKQKMHKANENHTRKYKEI